MHSPLEPLLGDDDPHPVHVVNCDAAGDFVLVCEHAGKRVPAALSGLGIAASVLDLHVGHDIGAAAVAQGIADRLGSVLVLQRYSRLVVDCNRPWGAPDLIPEIADGIPIAGNRGLSDAEQRRRHDTIHRPLHEAVSQTIDRTRPSALVAIHSFTRALADGIERTMELGLLFNRDARLAEALRDAVLAESPGTRIAMNAPYRVEDGADVTIPLHGEGRGLPHVLVEVRNDLISDDQGQHEWSERLSAALPRALSHVR
jgi:predicted N-formylglutamate amidohydrolase